MKPKKFEVNISVKRLITPSRFSIAGAIEKGILSAETLRERFNRAFSQSENVEVTGRNRRANGSIARFREAKMLKKESKRILTKIQQIAKRFV